MAVEAPGRRVGHLRANADYSARVAYQYRSVEITSTGTVARTNAANERILGVLYNAPKSGFAATVVVDGIVKWEAGGAFDPGDLLTCDNQGRCVEATSGQIVHGTATMTSGGAGEIVTVELTPNSGNAP